MPQERLPVATKVYHVDSDEWDREKHDAEIKRLLALSLDERVTEREYWVCKTPMDDIRVRVDIVNDILGFHKRLVVNNNEGPWSGGGDSPTLHPEGFVLFDDYWDGFLPVNVPQRLLACKPD